MIPPAPPPDLLAIAAALPRLAPSSPRSDRPSRRRSGRSDRARARLLVGACWRGLLIKMGSLSAAGAPGRVIPAARLEICDLSGAFLGLCVGVGAGGVVVLRFEGRGDGRRRGEVPAGDGGGAQPLGGVLRLHRHLQQGSHELPRLQLWYEIQSCPRCLSPFRSATVWLLDASAPCFYSYMLSAEARGQD